MISIETFFSNEGPLADTIPGYRPRVAQIEMAQAVARAIEQEKHFIAEAGTGTGKTFAYLIAAILSGRKTLISTGTKNLQDQLFDKDLPVIRKALKVPFCAALLKGRANYLCLYRMENALGAVGDLGREEIADLEQIKSWSKRTDRGDISDMPVIPEQAPVWYHATSTVDNCLGQDCPVYDECYLVKARKRAQEAEILVVNHHLLCADWSLKETGFGELLPDMDVILVDEAHQLADTASNFIGDRLGAKQFLDLASDTLIEFHQDAKDMPALRSACEDLTHETKNLRLAFGMELRKGEWKEIAGNAKITHGLDSLRLSLEALGDQLEPAAARSKGLESCYKRSEELEKSLQTMLEPDSGKWVRWFEVHRKTFTLSRTPLDIAETFREFMQYSRATWIFTSATLSVAHKFDHFTRSLGIDEAMNQSWESPFDYPNQSLFYHPRKLPQPASPDFVRHILDFIKPVLLASRGRTFILFTSHRSMQEAAQLLDGQLEYPLLVQGDRPKGLLLEQFRTLGNAILLATASFWEGVDVRGEALSCVIIEKLPFASPGDPVLKARLQAMEKQGQNPFMEYQLPAAVIALRQGIGRLIRDINDRGVLMICDPRLLKRSYGQIFLDSVPQMRRTRELTDVKEFFAENN